MSAVENWKAAYRRAKYAKENFSKWEYFDIMATAASYRREAALERKLEAAQRTIEAQYKKINELSEFIYIYCDTAEEEKQAMNL